MAFDAKGLHTKMENAFKTANVDEQITSNLDQSMWDPDFQFMTRVPDHWGHGTDSNM